MKLMLIPAGHFAASPLAACSSLPAHIEDMPPPPTQAEVAQLTRKVMSELQKPGNVEVLSIKPARISEGYDFVACLRINGDGYFFVPNTETKVGPFITPEIVKSAHTTNKALMVRRYDDD